jgi:glycosyltransferase involved in cell wall biosynthesis
MTPFPDTRALCLSQAFLPGGGGLEKSIDFIVRAFLAHDFTAIEAITLYKPDYSNADQEAFDAHYPIPVRRTGRLHRQLAGLARYHGAYVDQASRLGIAGYVASAILGTYTVAALAREAAARTRRADEPIVILHCFSLSALGAAYLASRLARGKTVRIVFNCNFAYQRTGSRAIDAILVRLFAKAACILCISRYTADMLIENFRTPPERTLHYHNWIDSSALPLRKRYPPSSRTIRMLFVGRIVPEKGVSAILALARHISEAGLGDAFAITVLGTSDHPIAGEVRAAAETYSFFRFPGRLDPPALWDCYEEHDVVLMPSVWDEGFGRGIIEAYALGIPVVGSNKGAIPEVLRHFPIHAILAELSPAALRAAARRLVAEVDAYGRERFARDTRRIVRETFDERNFAAFMDVYASLSDAHGTRSP